MGNIYARYEGTDPERDPVAIGSHLDSQPTGGKFDGAYGVMVGLEVIRAIHDTGTRTAAPIEVISWTNEEGARFPPAMIGSGVYGGAFSLEEGLGATAMDGAKLGDELTRIGYSGPEPPGSRTFAQYIEPHIEQGPILEAGGDTIGVVTGVQGIRWFDVTISGREAHAGTTPMERRSDAMVSAGRLTAAIDDIGRARPDGRSTVGVLTSTPASRNTVAGHVQLTVDLRHPDPDELERMSDELHTAADALAPRPGVTQIWYSPPLLFDEAIVSAVRSAAEDEGHRPVDITSGAGHDAVYVARLSPTGMIFIPCEDGLSHNEAENITRDHAVAGAEVTLRAVLELAS